MDPPSKKRRLAPKAPSGSPHSVNSQQASAPLNPPVVEPAPLPARHEFERFARHLQDAAMLIQRSAERHPYTGVSVLLLRWEEDISVEQELVALEQVFRDHYNYRTDRWAIPTVPNPSIKLGVQMASFLEHARTDHLLIIYYAGHGYVGPDNHLYWASHSREDAAKLKWDGVRCLFEDAQSDILLLLDTCCIRDAPLAGSHGLKQAVAAWGPEHAGRESGGRSFTSALIEALQKLGSTKSPFSVQLLYEEIVGRKHTELSHGAITNGAGKQLPLKQMPSYFPLTPGKWQSITLSPLSPDGLPQVQSSANQIDGEGEPTRTPRQESIIDADAVLELRFDDPRVLVCTTFVGEASPDMNFFNNWLEDTPAIAENVTVEAMFFGPPTMLLISMSHPMWEIVRHDKVCIFLGYIGSHNFVHLYQKLIGFVGSKRVGKATAKEVEDGRILLEAREAAVVAKRATRGSGVNDESYRKPVPCEPPVPPMPPIPPDAMGSDGPRGDSVAVRFASSSQAKDEGEDSAEMKEAAEQLKALSHIRHLTADAPPEQRRRSTLPDSAPDRQEETSSSHDANDSGAEGSIHFVNLNSPDSKPKARRLLQRQTLKQEVRCSRCNHPPFKDSSSLRKHIAAAHTRPFPCAFSFAGCTSTFGSKNEWKRHISSQHLCLQFYRCSSCPTSAAEGKFNEFNRKDLFTQHLRRMHAPFAIKKSIAKGDSKLQAEWEHHVREMQQSCLVQRRQPPQRSACPKPDCQSVFEGPGSWDEWTEHVGRHMEKNEGQRLGVDRHLAKWALEEGIIERDDDGEYKLVHEGGFASKMTDHTKDSIAVASPLMPKREQDESPGEDEADKMEVDS